MLKQSKDVQRFQVFLKVPKNLKITKDLKVQNNLEVPLLITKSFKNLERETRKFKSTILKFKKIQTSQKVPIYGFSMM